MKVKKISIIMCILFALPFVSCKKKSNEITVSEVTHSLFYAPMYIAKEKGFFNEEGLDVSIITSAGADKVMASLLSKDATIGLMGPEASVYVYNNGQKDYAVNFAQLTKKDGSFLLGRNKEGSFTYNNLKGKTIIGGRQGGMPEMVLEYVLKSKGYSITRNSKDMNADINIRTDISFDVMTGAFINGEADYVTAFEPNASQIELSKKGYIVSSIGDQLDEEIPYTCFSALKSVLDTKKEEIKKFVSAIEKGLNYVLNHTSEELVPLLTKEFSSNTHEEIKHVIDNYKSIDVWPKNTYFTKKSFDKLIEIVTLAGELDKSIVIPYDKLVNQDFL